MLVDDHPVVRQGIKFSLIRDDRITLAGEAADGEEALRVFAKCSPDIVLMDVNLPGLNGFEATRKLLEEFPAARVLFLSGHKEPEYLRRIRASGARGYVLKDASPDELVRAIHSVYAGAVFFSPEIVQLALNASSEESADEKKSRRLSRRERDVLTLIAQERTNKEIAQRLGLALRTVETYRERIMQKLEIHTVVGLTKFAVKQGWVTLDIC